MTDPTLESPVGDALRAADVVTIVGTRPQLIKAAEVSRRLAEVGLREVLIHTGQHYDPALTDAFMAPLGLRAPDLDLGVGSLPHGAQTGRMLEGIERALVAAAPNRPRVLVYGDCNSTLAGALAAAKLGLPVDHVEAGLRSFVPTMPEEINRVLTDRLADLLLCPTPAAVTHLAAEGLTQNVHLVGDVTCDAVTRQLARAPGQSPAAAWLAGDASAAQAARAELGLNEGASLPTPGAYRLATVHRAATTDDPEALARVLDALDRADLPTVLLLHPRTRARIDAFGLGRPRPGLVMAAPTPYHATLALAHHAHQVVTDSGGLQKEALLVGTACVTLRDQTEWVETVTCGWNRLVGTDPEAIAEALDGPAPQGAPPALYGDGQAARRMAALIHQAHRGHLPMENA